MRHRYPGTSVRLMRGGRHGTGRLSPATVAHALLSVLALSVAVGYLAGVFFRHTPSATAPTVPTIGRYTSLETPPPPTGAPATQPPNSATPRSDGGQQTAAVAPRTASAPRLAQAPSSPPQPVPPSPHQPVAPSAANTLSTAPAAKTATDAVVLQRFHVEIGAYQSPMEAEAVARDLRRRGYAVHVGQSAPYGVRVGGFLDRPTAERLLRVLSAAGFEAALIAR